LQIMDYLQTLILRTTFSIGVELLVMLHRK
jgi:hypothetical protein